jgi:hypothetical protein
MVRVTPNVFGFRKRLGISWPSEWLSASEEVLFSLKLGSLVQWLTAACMIVVTYPVDRKRFSAPPPHFEISFGFHLYSSLRYLLK